MKTPVPSASDAEAAAKAPAVTLAAIAGTFGYIGATSFGGGLSAYLRDALVARRRWITDQEYLEGRELSQLLPGPNPINLSVYIGQRLRGAGGALVAVMGAVIPGSIFVLILGALYFHHGTLPAVSAAFQGIGAAAAGLTLSTALKVGHTNVKDARGIIFVVVTFASVHVLHVSMPLTLLIVTPVSIWLCRPRRRAAAAEKEGDRGAGE
jgi:chromate transporter